MIIRRPDDVVEVEATDENDAWEYDEYMETSERFELVRVSCMSATPSSASGPIEDSRERPPVDERL